MYIKKKNIEQEGQRKREKGEEENTVM